jgi:DNA uptake protein ComE-like DNA-binding protein
MQIMKHPVNRDLFRAILLLGFLVFMISLGSRLDRMLPGAERWGPPVVVQVLGEVARPGIHLLEGPGGNVAQAVAAAGGLRNSSPGTDTTGGKDFDEPVSNGQTLWITRGLSGECSASIEPMPAAGRLTVGCRLDLNLASEVELCLVPQMKPEIASQIVLLRREKPWTSLRELEGLPGVGRRTTEKWKDFLEVKNKE